MLSAVLLGGCASDSCGVGRVETVAPSDPANPASLMQRAEAGDRRLVVQNAAALTDAGEVLVVVMKAQLREEIGRWQLVEVAGLEIFDDGTGAVDLAEGLNWTLDSARSFVRVSRVWRYADGHKIVEEWKPRPWAQIRGTETYRGGVLAVRCTGTLVFGEGGRISADGAGYSGGREGWPEPGTGGHQGEGWGPNEPADSARQNLCGGGGGRILGDAPMDGGGGGGGANPATAHEGADGAPGFGKGGGEGGAPLELQDSLTLGAGGGGGAGALDRNGQGGLGGAPGGRGGGILLVLAEGIRVEREAPGATPLITSRGIAGADAHEGNPDLHPGGGGGGAGGTIAISGLTPDSGVRTNVSGADGGESLMYAGGDGARGRVFPITDPEAPDRP